MARASHRSGRRRQNQGRAEGLSVPRAKGKSQAVGRTGKGHRDVRPESLPVDAGPSEPPGRRSFGGDEAAMPRWLGEVAHVEILARLQGQATVTPVRDQAALEVLADEVIHLFSPGRWRA